MKGSNIFLVIGTALVLAGAVLCFFNIREDANAATESAAVVAAIKKTAPATEKSEEPNYLKNPYMEMPLAHIRGNDYIGYLSFLDLNLRLPVLSEWSDNGLRIAPARYKGSVYLDNMILLGHNYRSHFGRCHRLALGSVLVFRDMDQNEFIYELIKKEVLLPHEAEALESGNWDLTLFTCTDNGRKRMVFRYKRIQDKTIISLKEK